MARSPELLPQPCSPLLPLPTHWNHAHGGVEMIDAAISARPLEEAAMLQHVLDSAELRKKTEDFAAIEVIASDCLCLPVIAWELRKKTEDFAAIEVIASDCL